MHGDMQTECSRVLKTVRFNLVFKERRCLYARDEYSDRRAVFADDPVQARNDRGLCILRENDHLRARSAQPVPKPRFENGYPPVNGVACGCVGRPATQTDNGPVPARRTRTFRVIISKSAETTHAGVQVA